MMTLTRPGPLCLMVTMALLAAPSAAADDWARALRPLETMPVQDYGYIRSGLTFAENHLSAITGKTAWDGRAALPAVMWLMAHDEARMREPLIKIIHPELVDIFGDSRISVEQYRAPEDRAGLMGLIDRDPRRWLDPIREVELKTVYVEQLDADFAIVPRHGEWLSPLEIPGRPDADAIDRDIAVRYVHLRDALRADDAEAGAEAARRLAGAVHAAARARSVELPNLRLDAFYHRLDPFKQSAWLYFLAAMIYTGALVSRRPRVAWFGFALLCAGFALQCIGLGARWILADRAPVSNLYESFTYAIAGMVLLGGGFHAVQRIRLAGLGAALLGAIFMVLAHNAPIMDSQIRPLMPALQSSWLTYHVMTILLSYSAFALSFFISVCYLVKDLGGGSDAAEGGGRFGWLPSLDALDEYNYRIIAVGFPLLTVGIITGAVWAGTAWGRPWGFDPKETWSAITWLVYAIVLHSRFLAGWKGRRGAILSLVGFACVLFTYIGVSLLLPGLHSYV